MVGSGWRRSVVLAGGVALTSAVIFAVAAPQTSAQAGTSLANRVRTGIRLLSGSGQDTPPSRLRVEARSPRLVADEIDKQLRIPTLLLWGDVVFDPRQGIQVPEGLPPELASAARALPASLAAAPDDVDYWIVQYDGGVEDIQKAIAQSGAEILGVVPNRAYLVRADGVQLRQLQAEGMVRWTGRNLPAWKFDSPARDLFALAQDLSTLPIDDRGLVRVALGLQPGLDDATAAAYIGHAKELPGVLVLNADMQDTGIPWLGRNILLGIDPVAVEATLTHVATLRDVASVTSAQIPVTHDDHAIWFVQSGNDQVQATNLDVSAPLFRRGITGRGLIGTVADSGLENDMCQMRYTSALNDVAWRVGPTSGNPATSVPDEQSLDMASLTPALRTRDRKVVAYYVQAGASAYSDAGQHGTSVAGCMVADNNSVLAARPLVRDLGERQNVRFWRIGGAWAPGQELRPDIRDNVDDHERYEDRFGRTYGELVQHHQAKDGMAPGAQLIFQDIGNDGGQLNSTEALASLLDQASRSGSSVHNASYGGLPCASCYVGPGAQADGHTWTRRDMVAFVAAGNDGPGGSTISAGHGHAKNTVPVGWSIRANGISCPNPGDCPNGTTPRLGHAMSVSSSRGPSAGGQIAPLLTAPGTVQTIADSSTPSRPEDGTNSSDGGCGPVSPSIIGGTSFASPIAAGAGLLVQQYFLDGFYPSGRATPTDALRPTNALVRAIMVNSARNLEGARTDDSGTTQDDRPNFGQGWGAPRLDDSLYFEGDPKINAVAELNSERARLRVLNDVPNGFEGVTADMVPEPGGLTRDQIIQGYSSGLRNRAIKEYQIYAINDADGDGNPDDVPGNELRFTLAWSDVPGSTGLAPQVNNLDLEVISPGPNGILESTDGLALRGDDVVYRPRPTRAVWVDGYTQPSANQAITTLATIDTPFADADLQNTVENIFIPASEVHQGTYLVRVIAQNIRAVGGNNGGYPNFKLNDTALTRDLDGDGVPDIDEFDQIRGEVQGYALIATGNFTSDQGLLAMNKSSFGCLGEVLTLALNDENGGASEAPCGTALEATLRTTTPSASFPADREIVHFTGSGPTYRSFNPATGLEGFDVVLVRNPADVIHGDGIIQVAHGETIIAEYRDNAPCGGRSFAQATLSCQPVIIDQGFIISEGCDYAEPGNPASGTRPDGFMDIGEMNRYQVFLVNTGGSDLNDAVISLQPDPADPYAGNVTVFDSPRRIGLMPPGRISDASFLVQIGAGVPPRHEMDFIVEVVSPRDGLLFPASFIQTQVLEADVVSFRYDTRDPNGELMGDGRIELLKPGVDEIPGGNPPSDYVTNEPMWWDPDANAAADCDIPRNLWFNRYTPPPSCLNTNDNPVDPWDFDDSNEGFFEAAHDGDTALMGPDFDNMWHWKASPEGGGCGWEDELHVQLATGSNPLPAGHPDRFAQPWGIWHTGQINNATAGPYAGNPADNQGVPFLDNPNSPSDHTIMWDPPPPGGGDSNTTGQWCNTYLSDSTLANFYRSMLVAPNLHRVHASNPVYRVEFQSFNWYSRLDAHTRNNSNLAALGWFVNNQPVEPSSVSPLAYTWNQFQYYTNIFSADVMPRWDVDDNTLGENLRNPNEDFQYLTYEDIFGPAAESWTVAFGWSHLNFDGYRSRGQYGAGIDDVSFVWTESRDDDDQSDCGLVAGGQRPIIWFAENRYNACEGVLDISLWAPDETKPVVAVAVSSAAEPVETALLYPDPATGRYEGQMRFTSETTENAVGVLLVSAGNIDIGSGADTIRVEYDPGPDSDPATSPEDRADWCDLDGNGINDDTDGDGIPDCEDDPLGIREVRDFAVINCTSGRLFYIKHELQQVGPGDGDRFADPGETQRMKVFLVSALGADLEDVQVRISTNDPVSIVNDTVLLPSLPGNGTIVDTGFGFEFCVPLGMQTTDIANPRTLTFRIDVRGRNTTNLNEFSTAGESFNTFLPLEAWMLVDVDARVTNADFVNSVSGRPVPPTGTFFEGFNGDPALQEGFDNFRAEPFQPGMQVVVQSTTSDTRFGMAGNSGFCPECDVQDDCSVVAGACDYYFSNDPAFTPGYALNEPPWSHTQAWAHEGLGSYKFGKLNAGPGVDDQHYPNGVYASLQLPPLRLATTGTPELSFWQIANVWGPFFTSGLFTPIDGFVVEVAPSAVGVGDSGTGDDRVNRSTQRLIQERFPISNFRRVSPFHGLYDWETDALNACRTLFCRYKHPVFAFQGSPTDSPASATDPERGVPGTVGTWKLSRIDLSDFRGMEVVIQFSAEVLQDLEVQNGSMGWFIDEVTVTGVSNRTALTAQGTNLATEACGIVADFAAEDPSCHGKDVQFYDRHAGVGAFDTSVSPAVPFPLEFEWIIGGLTLRGFEGVLIPSTVTGVFGTYDNPRINLRDSAAGVASPSSVPVRLNIYQDGVLASTITRSIVSKDAPVPVLQAVTSAFVGGFTQFTATATYNTGLDPDRTLYWLWDFGDGSTADASGPSVQHVYGAPGSYVVKLTVSDEEGCARSVTQTVNVTAAPLFDMPSMVPAADPDCGSPHGGDNNADIEELITVEIAFRNAPGAAAATGVTGYFSSPDPLVDIVTGVAFYGNVNAGQTTGTRSFRFIRRDDGTLPTCLVLPFQLTLVANGGAVVQVLDLSFTMGLAGFASFDNAGTQTGSFTRLPSGPNEDSELYTGIVAGCLTGLELDMDLTSVGQALVGDLRVEIIPPDGGAVTVLYPGNAPGTNGPYQLHFRFGATNGQGPIVDLAGQLEEVPPTVLDPTVASTLVSSMVGRSMAGTWRIRVSSTRLGATTNRYDFTINEFRLEGTSSGDLEVGTPIGCGDPCFAAGSPPVFLGARTDCARPNMVLFSPASDTWSCDGTSDVTYELWASQVAGQLGTRVDGTAREVGNCSSCADPDGACAVAGLDGATFWRVCDTTTTYWTVIAVDGSGPRSPAIGASSPSTENPGTYQTALADCVDPVLAGRFALVKSSATQASAWLTPVPGRPWVLYPPPNATEYRILRGTFPTAGGRAALLSDRGSPYDHVVRPGDCGFSTLTRDVSSDLTLAGSYYYLVPGVNTSGCGGMGSDSEGSPIPGTGTGCPAFPDCTP